MKPKAIICDLDGTLANIDHRRHFVECPPIEKIQIGGPPVKKDWRNFYAEIPHDTVNLWCLEILQRFSVWHLENRQIIFVSGRPIEYLPQTEKFLLEKCLMYPSFNGYKLFMRPSGDNRKDFEIKKEIYEREIKDKYDVLFVIEDGFELEVTR